MLEIFRNYYSKYVESNAEFHFSLNVLLNELRKLTIDGVSIDTRKMLKKLGNYISKYEESNAEFHFSLNVLQ